MRRAALVCAASACSPLASLGLRRDGRLGRRPSRALLGFNVGVELGQLSLSVPTALLLGVLRERPRAPQRAAARDAGPGAYVIGSASAYSCSSARPVLAELLRAGGLSYVERDAARPAIRRPEAARGRHMS